MKDKTRIVSVAARKKGPAVDQAESTTNMINQVELTKLQQDRYHSSLIMNKTSSYFPYIVFANELAYRVGAFLGLCRACLQKGRTLDNLPPEDVALEVGSMSAAIFAKATALSMRNASLDDYTAMTASGASHVIKKTSKGYDVYFAGSYGDTPMLMTNSFAEYTVTTFLNEPVQNVEQYMATKLESYSTSFSLKVLAAARELLTTLFTGDVSILDGANASKRVLRPLPYSFDFESLNDIFLKHTGIPLKTPYFVNAPSDLASNQMMSMVIGRTPKSSMLHSINGNRIVDLKSHIAEEGMLCSQDIGCGIAMTIDQDTANYISQTQPDSEFNIECLHNWLTQWARRYAKKPGQRTAAGRVRLINFPRFVSPATTSLKLTDIRRQRGYAIEPGKTDSNNIFIGADGCLNYGLREDQRGAMADNAHGYEPAMRALLNFCFEHGLPVTSNKTVNPNLENTLLSPEDIEQYHSLVRDVERFKGTLLYYDWDYNVIVTAGSDDPTSTQVRRTVGTTKVTPIVIADYLGFDFSAPGEQPLYRPFSQSLRLMMHMNSDAYEDAFSSIGETFSKGPFLRLFALYDELLQRGLVPNATDILATSKKNLNLDTYEGVQKQAHGTSITDTLDLDLPAGSDGDKLSLLLQRALGYCSGPMVAGDIMQQNPGVDQDTLKELIENHDLYFSFTKSKVADFQKVYALIGGNTFLEMCRAIMSVPHDELLIKSRSSSFDGLSRQILPLAALFSKYVPDSKRIFEQAEEEIERNTRDPSIDINDVQVSGSTAGAQLFPHQLDTHRSLRKRPFAAIFDIEAGGGKTSIGCTDIGAILKELDELGTTVRFLVLCPSNLVKNWVNDMKIHTGTNWNMIPIDTNTYNRVGHERIEQMIATSPKNTVTVVGFDVLSAKAEDVVFGTDRVRISGGLELIKKFKFDYILIDESHKVGKTTSGRHNNCKQLTTASWVQYIRLATGTLIHGRVNDVVGQAAMVNGHIFRNSEVLTAKESEASTTINGEEVPVFEVSSPKAARRKLGQYVSIVTKKKKDWAFMLPSPIETFFPIPLVPDEGDTDITETERAAAEAHRALYDLVVQQAEDEMAALIFGKKKKSSDDDEEGDDDDDLGEEDNDGEVTEDVADFDAADVGGMGGNLRKKLEVHIARLEVIVSNPMGDPLFAEVFGERGIQEYHSPVARFVGRRVRSHYNVAKWEKDKVYPEYAHVSHKGKTYLSKKVTSGVRREPLPEATRGIEPHLNTTYWREEPMGKVLIICTYKKSANGLFAALPDDLKSQARLFHSDVPGKYTNLMDFQTSAEVNILVATEGAISEGHNLQMASRLIRVESPWNPGTLEQTASRNFRPDVEASKAMMESGRAGELYREVIFVDWVLCDGTLQVQKQARLIKKMVDAARFNEADSEAYQKVFADIDLEEVPMSLELLSSRDTLNSYMDYTRAYADLNGVRNQEFNDRRREESPTMIDLPVTPAVTGSSIIETTFIENQKPADNTLGLVTVRNALATDVRAQANPESLLGSPVVTDLGKGIIYSMRYTYEREILRDEQGKPVLSGGKEQYVNVTDSKGNPVLAKPPITSVTVQLVTGEKVTIKEFGAVFIATKLPPKRANEFRVSEKPSRKREIDELMSDRTAKKKEALDKEKAAARTQKVSSEKAKQRKKNIAEGKPINNGVRRVSSIRGLKPALPVPEEKPTITLHPALYHGYLTLEVRSDDEVAGLNKLGFKHTGPYAHCSVKRYNQFAGVLDFLEDEKKFVLSAASIKRLEAVDAAFEEGKRGLYAMQLLPASGLPYFFATRRQKVTNRKEIRPYPILLPNELQIAVDVDTSPAIRKYVGQSIAGAATKWQLHPGHELYFAKNKTDLKAKLAEVRKAGFVVDNLDEVTAEIANIKFRAPK